MNTHWVYLHSRTGIIHLADFDDISRGLNGTGKTLCGMKYWGMTEGDETMSGIAATCGLCTLRRQGK